MKPLMPRDDYQKWFESSNSCLLCQPDEQIVLKEYKHWLFIVNRAPYRRYHTMIIPKRHVKHLHRLNYQETITLPKVYQDVMKRYKSTGVKLEDGEKPDRYLVMIHASQEGLETKERPEHLHIHFLPYRTGLLSPLMLPETIKFKLDSFIKKIRSYG